MSSNENPLNTVLSKPLVIVKEEKNEKSLIFQSQTNIETDEEGSADEIIKNNSVSIKKRKRESLDATMNVTKCQKIDQKAKCSDKNSINDARISKPETQLNNELKKSSNVSPLISSSETPRKPSARKQVPAIKAYSLQQTKLHPDKSKNRTESKQASPDTVANNLASEQEKLSENVLNKDLKQKTPKITAETVLSSIKPKAVQRARKQVPISRASVEKHEQSLNQVEKVLSIESKEPKTKTRRKSIYLQDASETITDTLSTNSVSQSTPKSTARKQVPVNKACSEKMKSSNDNSKIGESSSSICNSEPKSDSGSSSAQPGITMSPKPKTRRKSTVKPPKNEIKKLVSTCSAKEDEEVSQIKEIFEDLKNGSTKDPEVLKSKLENLMGPEGIAKLKTLFTESTADRDASEKNSKCDDGNDSEDDVPLKNLRSIGLSKKKQKKRKKQTESEKLKNDIMNCFIRDEVLAATGLRRVKTKLYSEMMMDYEDSDTSETSEALSENNDNLNEEKPLQIKECSIALEKLDITGMTMPVTIKNNQIHRVQEDVTTKQTSTDLVVSTLEPEEDLPITVIHLATEESETIVIDDDSDEEGTFKSVTDEKLTKKDFQEVKPTHLVKHEFLSPTSKLVSNCEKKVYNLSFVRCRAGVTLKCNGEKCLFETCSDQMFQYHIQTKHLFLKWSGWCLICNKSVSNFGLLLDEYNHMHDTHITLKEKLQAPPVDDKPKTVKHQTAMSPQDDGEKRKRGRPKKISPIDNADIPKPSAKETTPKVIFSVSKSSLPMPLASSTPLSKSNTLLNTDPVLQYIQTINDHPRAVAATPITGTIVLSAPIAVVNPSVNSQPLSQPVIKFRNLPGDKLSNNKPAESSDDQPREVNKVVRTFIVKRITQGTNLFTEITKKDIESDTTSLSVKEPLASSSFYQQTLTELNLRPWLESADKKTSQNVNEMMKNECLVAKYKCMGSDCSFYTTDMKTFQIHLEMHENDLSQDKKYFGRCPYCKNVEYDLQKLTHHIRTNHRYACFNCPKCFYRAVTKVQVHLHQEKYHNDFSRTILACDEEASPKFFTAAMAEANRNIPKFVSQMTCARKLN